MTRTMKAAVVRQFGRPLAIEEVPVPEPKENQILVRIAATGICHTDLHAAKGDWPVKPTPPFIPGHEGVGTVTAIGRDVLRIKEGDRVQDSVAAYGMRLLLVLPDRLGDAVRLAVEQRLFGERQLRRVCTRRPELGGAAPSSLEWGPAAPILCAHVTVYRGLKETEVQPGK